MATTKVKICGVRRLEDAQVAADAGADFIGLVFVPGRPRRVDIPTASAIVAGIKTGIRPGDAKSPRVVGLFADQSLEEVNQIVEACGLDFAQLCGQESLEYCRGTKCQVIKVIHVHTGSPNQNGEDSLFLETLAEKVRSYSDAGNLVTLDRLVDGIPGGTGESFDWTVAAGLARGGHSFILAGGLSPDTVGKAIEEVAPWGVDVSSGVETQGVKDPEKIRSFIRNARLRD